MGESTGPIDLEATAAALSQGHEVSDELAPSTIAAPQSVESGEVSFGVKLGNGHA